MIGDEQQRTEISSALVLQCRQCRTIVGDTSTVCHLDAQSRSITIQRKNDNLTIDGSLHTSTAPEDYGSTFQHFSCAHCGCMLGRMYRSTPSELDHLRGNFTFSMDSLTYYELGLLNTGPNAQTTNSAISVNLENHPEILKLQRFCLYLLDRLNNGVNPVSTSKRSTKNRKHENNGIESPQGVSSPRKR